ncbi:hypothetical protein RRG08_047345 [Elysia crispata]|uniref:SEA domain-containing protein n=1 Tax=Elysia crispata TaxID=231223 RepID=A0AAE1A3X9_9GAST|nr:hypothetical protein RRG08_047345 [Elysia crispata]
MARTLAEEEEDRRPHWLKALDRNTVHTSRPEDWNRSIASSLTNTTTRGHKQKQNLGKHKRDRIRFTMKFGENLRPNSGFSGRKMHRASSIQINSVTDEKTRRRRGKSEGRGAHGEYVYGAAYPAVLYRSRSSDTSSVGSRRTTSSARQERKRSRLLALFCILLILAFLLAALIGWLTYFLLMRDRSNKEGNVGARNSSRAVEVDADLRILNETFTTGMSNSSSYDFLRVAVPVCEEVDLFFRASNYSDSYINCEVKAIKRVSETSVCQCVWSNDASLLVDFTLTFNGSHGLDMDSLRWYVYDVVDAGTTKHFLGQPGQQLVYVLLRQFLVDIRAHWDNNFDGVEAKLTIPVFNLNYTYTLENRNSPDFRRIATPFCADVRRILTNKLHSPFADRYYSCYVTDFSPGPDRITFHVQFLGREWRKLQKEVVYVLIEGATVATIQQQTVKLVGTLIVTPYRIDFTLIPINVTRTTPTTSTTVTTTPTTTMPDLTYIYVVFETWNQTLTPALLDPNSRQFQIITDEFCQDLERLFDNSIYGYRFHNCRVLAFRRNPTSIVVSVGYVGGPWSGMGTSVEYVIRRHAPGYYYETKELYLVGSIYFILGNVIANATELRTNLRVMNLTFTPDLSDQRTSRFQYYALLFCRDMQKYYSQSMFAQRFFECGVDSFSDNPVRIHFYLVFYGTDLGDGVVTSVPKVIRRFAPPVYYLVYLTYRVGDLLVLPEKRPGVDPPPSVYPTNITVFPSTPGPTTTVMTTSLTDSTTISPSSSYIVTPNGILLILYYEVYNLTYTSSLMYPTSPEFTRHRDAVCDDAPKVYVLIYSVGRRSSFAHHGQVHNQSLLNHGDRYDPSYPDLDLNNRCDDQQHDLLTPTSTLTPSTTTIMDLRLQAVLWAPSCLTSSGWPKLTTYTPEADLILVVTGTDSSWTGSCKDV